MNWTLVQFKPELKLTTPWMRGIQRAGIELVQFVEPAAIQAASTWLLLVLVLVVCWPSVGSRSSRSVLAALLVPLFVKARFWHGGLFELGAQLGQRVFGLVEHL